MHFYYFALKVALSLGSVRPIRFQSIHGDTCVRLRNVAGGDVYAFPKLVNQAYTHQVCQAEESTSDEDIRLSIIIWGRARKLEEPATTNLTLADICKETPNLFEVVETINFGAESVEFDWHETYTL